MNSKEEAPASVTLPDLIERWSNVQRVLDAMPEHDRQHHWNMSVWGQETDCGTVACAAGHCGLDPWFRERGFKLEIVGDDANISDVNSFFGCEGSGRIFLNSARRSVETVIDEVRTFSAELQRATALMNLPGVPAIGEHWPEQGGIFAGPRPGVDGEPDYFLIVGPEHDGNLNWQDATTWATSVVVNEHRDFALPLMRDGHALFDRVANHFEREWYWLAEQHESSSSYAWVQDFLNGDQYYWDEGSKLRARAVRRLVIR